MATTDTVVRTITLPLALKRTQPTISHFHEAKAKDAERYPGAIVVLANSVIAQLGKPPTFAHWAAGLPRRWDSILRPPPRLTEIPAIAFSAQAGVRSSCFGVWDARRLERIAYLWCVF